MMERLNLLLQPVCVQSQQLRLLPDFNLTGYFMETPARLIYSVNSVFLKTSIVGSELLL